MHSRSALRAALLDTGREHGKTKLRTGQVIQMRATGIGQAIHIAQLQARVEISIGVLKPIHHWRVHEMRTLLPPLTQEEPLTIDGQILQQCQVLRLWTATHEKLPAQSMPGGLKL